jgi:SAM-dependent methyltransferase
VSTIAGRVDHEVAFHDAECGAYAADLGLWVELAAIRKGPLLDLGAGTGRTALALAAVGHRVVAVDRDRALLGALAKRAARRGLVVETVAADVCELELGRRFALAIAPMQLFQLFDRRRRARALGRLAEHLEPGGLLAVALVDESLPLSGGDPEPRPDVREVDGWLHSSLPLEVRATAASIEVRRLRQIVAPDGELSERSHTVTLQRIEPGALEREALAAGLQPSGRKPIPESAEHVASLAVLLEAPR